MGAMTRLNPRAALFVLILPFVGMRSGMVVGNWGQHAFVDEDDPDSNFRSSITLINIPVSPHTNFLANFNFELNPRATTREVWLVIGEWEEDLQSQKWMYWPVYQSSPTRALPDTIIPLCPCTCTTAMTAPRKNWGDERINALLNRKSVPNGGCQRGWGRGIVSMYTVPGSSEVHPCVSECDTDRVVEKLRHRGICWALVLLIIEYGWDGLQDLVILVVTNDCTEIHTCLESPTVKRKRFEAREWWGEGRDKVGLFVDRLPFQVSRSHDTWGLRGRGGSGGSLPDFWLIRICHMFSGDAPSQSDSE